MDKLGLEMQLISLQNASKAFEKSAEAGDESSGNKSYRGMCVVDLARLNRFLNRYSRAEIREKLEEAEDLLQEALAINLRELKVNDIHKDHSRLAECQFRLADLVNDDINEKRVLHEHSIQNYKNAEDLLVRQKKPVNPEIFNFIAANYDRLAEISLDKNKKKECLEKAKKYFDRAKRSGERSSESRAKSGNCSYRILKLESSRLTMSRISKRIRETKQILEEALCINGQGHYVYPLVLLYYLSKDIEDGQIPGGNPGKFDLKKSIEYIREALYIYTSNPNWAVRQLSEGANFVCESSDNYGLLDETFVLKHGKIENLEGEIRITEQLRDILKEKLPGSKYLVPKPLCIFEHIDADRRLSGNYYAMTRKHGMTLGEFLSDNRINQNKKLGALEGVIDYLAFIHANVAGDKEPQDYRSKLEERLAKLERISLVDNLTRQQIIDNYAPVLESFQNATLVFNKDAHPRNWVVTYGMGIVSLDFEDKKGSVPAEFDLVNLVEFADYPESRGGEVRKNYFASFKKYSGMDVNYDETRYWNAFVHQAISVVAIQAQRGKPAYPKCVLLLNKMLEVIKELSYRCSPEHSDNYSRLYEGFRRIKESISRN